MIFLVMHGSLLWETNKLKQYLRDKGYAYSIVTTGEVLHGRVTIDPAKDMCIGPVETLHHIWSKNNIRIPDSNHYPEELNRFLYRGVRRIKLRDLPEDYRGFIKPVQLKLFDGTLINSNADLFDFRVYPSETEVYISDRVNFVTEWRYYIVDGELKACGNYLGDESVEPDIQKVKAAVDVLKNRCRNYCLDFGVLDSGETALVEWTDGYSIGWYPEDGIDIYFNLLYNRWQEIVEAQIRV